MVVSVDMNAYIVNGPVLYIRFDNPNALFCLREPGYLKDIPSNMISRFVDKEELSQHHLKVLSITGFHFH